MSRSICIDIDGTMSDPYFFVPYLNKMTGIELSNEEYISNNWNKTYGPQFKEIYENFDIDYPYIYEEVEILEGVKETIDQLIENGDDVHFVTARDHIIDPITKKWLEDNGIDSTRVYSLGGNEGKVDMAEKLNCDFFLEDDPENAKNLLKAGFRVIIMDTNYNKNIISDLEKEENLDLEKIRKRLKRVKNWDEIKNILL